MTELTQDFLREFFHYDPETGSFKRVKRLSWKGNIVECDKTPSSTTSYGYLQVNLGKVGGGRPHLVHRLIFLYMTGEMPEKDVDHINGDRLDNRWCNLRLVDRQTNLRNMGVRSDNSSGYPGVSFAKDRNKWHAYIGSSIGERITLGHFGTREEAVAARKGAEMLLGYHENHGKRPGWGN